jgi:hypothetical protein
MRSFRTVRQRVANIEDRLAERRDSNPLRSGCPVRKTSNPTERFHGTRQRTELLQAIARLLRTLLEVEACRAALAIVISAYCLSFRFRCKGRGPWSVGRVDLVKIAHDLSRQPTQTSEDTLLSGSSARLQAIEAVTTYHPTAAPL